MIDEINDETIKLFFETYPLTVCRRKGYRVNRHFLDSDKLTRPHKPIQNKEKSQGTPSVS